MATDPVAAGQFTRLTDANYHDAFNIQFISHPVPWSEATFADCLTTPYSAWSLSDNEQVVGYYVTLLVAGEATLMDIGVAPPARRKGYGRLLLEHAIDQSIEHEAEQLWLEVRQSNTGAQQLYQQFGFELIEQRKGYYPSADGREDALIMRLALPQK